MKEYVKKFDTAASANDYSIVNIPFMTSVATNPIQNLVCNASGKKLINTSGVVTVVSAGPEPPVMVDLGLSVKWAQYNFGVNEAQLTTAADWYGNFYAWGEIETKTDYSWTQYLRHSNGNYVSAAFTKAFTKYIPTDKENDYWAGEGNADNKLVLEAVDDICTATYGAGYRMPTKTEIEELIGLPNEWVTDYNGISGLNGRVFTGNGNTLFIPAAGYFNGSSHHDAGSYCYLWSSSLDADYPAFAWRLYFYSDGIYADFNDRCYGLSVRCVSTI